jgi:hypothetical protein
MYTGMTAIHSFQKATVDFIPTEICSHSVAFTCGVIPARLYEQRKLQGTASPGANFYALLRFKSYI